MKQSFFTIAILICLALLPGCNKSAGDAAEFKYEIVLSDTLDEPSWYDLFESVSYIPLKTDIPMGQIDQIVVRDGLMYVIADGLFCFDMEGNCKFGNINKGRARNEFLKPSSLSVFDGKVFVYDRFKNQMLVFDAQSGSYIDSFDDADGYEVWREYKDHQRNKVNSFDFNISYNLSDKVYFGYTFGILSAVTNSEGYFYDYYAPGNHPDFPNGLDYTCVDKMNRSDGAGWNMAFGTIIRPVQALRLGAAIKTPTYFHERLEYSDYLYAVMGEGKDGDKFNNDVEYKYSSPWSIDLSAGLTFGGSVVNVALGAEYEKHFASRSSLSIGNTKMLNQGAVDYKDFSVLKTGFELNVSNFSIRSGFGYKESMFNDGSYPYLYDSDFNGWKNDSSGNLAEVGRTDFQIDRPGKTRYVTFGLGYCSTPDRDGTQFYIDLAYVNGLKGSIVNVNEYAEDVDVKYNYKSDKIQLTFGWNF